MRRNKAHAAPRNAGITSRPYQGSDDLVQMQQLIAEGRRQSDDWHYPHIGDLAFWFFMIECHLEAQQFVRVWQDAQGRLVGYAMLGEDPTFEWQVLPQYEWHGIENEALAWADQRLDELEKVDARAWGGKLTSGGRQDAARRIGFLEEHGFRQGNYSEVNMMCQLQGNIGEAVVPLGWQIRAVEEAELTRRAGAQREVWKPWTVGNVSDADYARLMHLPGYEQSLDIVAVSELGIIGAYVNGWMDALNRVGDLGPVGALAEHRRQGLTRAVLLECMRRMQQAGMQRVSVSTGVNNEPALRLYESVGFRAENHYHEYVRAKNV